MQFIKTRFNEVKKIQKECFDMMTSPRTMDIMMESNNDQLRNIYISQMTDELRVLNETLAMTCDYLATIANILNSYKGGK